ncbi:hypothetical protein DPMN_121503 [Dreissena polymorpha]|uniref:Uncharacterized protein n=1 Tax=Dreissena polymorpha TaxID=45954 RepID=A0A9D4GM73_DREPO|nr:hypothetical protein DPMN_121503 [Dreissena polymorpha]
MRSSSFYLAAVLVSLTLPLAVVKADGMPLGYPFIHLGGEEQMWDKFIAQENSSDQGGIRTRDLSISKPASHH